MHPANHRGGAIGEVKSGMGVVEWGNLRFSSLNGRKMVEALPLISDASSFGPASVRSQRWPWSIQLRPWFADEMGRNEPLAGSTSDEPPLSFDDEEKNGN